ncbi:F420H2 dehydrogenase subunit F [Clostridiales bacterium CHKCI006]|nr:F420H2 dehydrogenase subunit F [Clostridiales bacterium CHKCI006]
MIKNSVFETDDLSNCTSCGICAATCPKSAIQLCLDESGFYRPIINEKKCVSCGICKKYCYRFDKNIIDTVDNIYAYSAITKDKSLLRESSSGGISEEIMKECISQGYTIIGVEYDCQSNKAYSTLCKNTTDLAKYRGSKYMQSYTLDALKIIIGNTTSKYAIFGTPCQIYALNKYAKNIKRENLLLIDIFCHGVPSYFLWNAYINSSGTTFSNIKFRTKDYGWHNYAIKMTNSQGKTTLSKKINDPFFDLFFSKLCFNPACYSCKLRSTFAYTDIRIGDYWGPRFNNNYTGVSAVITLSKNGENIISNISNKILINSRNWNEIIENQSYGKTHKYDKERYDQIISNLKANKINEAYTIYLKTLTKRQKIIKSIKNIIKTLPKPLQFSLRSFFR